MFVSQSEFARFVAGMKRFPWRASWQGLLSRFRSESLIVTASSLTFTTVMALVPLVTVALAVFTLFPMFGKLQDMLQHWLVESLVPVNIARNVIGYLSLFSAKANKVGAVGALFLLSTALALIFTIDRTLNRIWRAARPRRWTSRLMVYWAVLTLGPLLLATSVTITSYLWGWSQDVVGPMPLVTRWLLDLLEILLVSTSLMALYRFVPNADVPRGHAWTGGALAGCLLLVAKKLLTVYISVMPTYSAVYGAFATIPILLIWIDLVWIIVLAGAVFTAHLPALLAGAVRATDAPGWEVDLALDVLRRLSAASARPARTLDQADLVLGLQVDPARLLPVLDALVRLGWIGRLAPLEDNGDTRWVLLVDPQTTPVQPLMAQLLLAPTASTRALAQGSGWSALSLASVL